MTDLAAAPGRAVEILRREMRLAPEGPSDANLDHILAVVDSTALATRERASAGYGEAAVPGVRKRLEAASSAEVGQRGPTIYGSSTWCDLQNIV